MMEYDREVDEVEVGRIEHNPRTTQRKLKDIESQEIQRLISGLATFISLYFTHCPNLTSQSHPSQGHRSSNCHTYVGILQLPRMKE